MFFLLKHTHQTQHYFLFYSYIFFYCLSLYMFVLYGGCIYSVTGGREGWVFREGSGGVRVGNNSV